MLHLKIYTGNGVNGADLEYILQITLKFHGEGCCSGVYILKRAEIKVKITINHGIK